MNLSHEIKCYGGNYAVLCNDLCLTTSILTKEDSSFSDHFKLTYEGITHFNLKDELITWNWILWGKIMHFYAMIFVQQHHYLQTYQEDTSFSNHFKWTHEDMKHLVWKMNLSHKIKFYGKKLCSFMRWLLEANGGS